MRGIWSGLVAAVALGVSGSGHAHAVPPPMDRPPELIELPAPVGLARLTFPVRFAAGDDPLPVIAVLPDALGGDGRAEPYAEALWHAAEIEEDARALLQGRMSDGVLQTLRAYRYEPGPGIDGYVVCGAVWRAGEVVGFATFYAATEDSIGFARAAGPIFQGLQAGAAASREIVGKFCQRAGPSDTTTDISFSVAETEAR